MPSIISAKFIGGISFYDPVWSQHQNPVKLDVDTPGSTDIVTATEVQQRNTPSTGVLIHHKTRKRELVDALFELGLCISYDHVLSISTILGNNLCRQFEIEKNV